MIITKELINYVANLARLELTEAELESQTCHLAEIVNFVEQLNKVDITGIEPTVNAMKIENVYRQDTAKDSLPKLEVLAMSPVKDDSFFVVPKVIE